MGLRRWVHRITAPPPPGRAAAGPTKLVLVVNQGLKMGKGKVAAQAGHACVHALLGLEEAHHGVLDAWLSSGQRKICVKGQDADHLLALQSSAQQAGLPTSLVRDAGHTQIPAGSLTVLSIGPANEEALDAITGDLPLL